MRLSKAAKYARWMPAIAWNTLILIRNNKSYPSATALLTWIHLTINANCALLKSKTAWNVLPTNSSDARSATPTSVYTRSKTVQIVCVQYSSTPPLDNAEAAANTVHNAITHHTVFRATPHPSSPPDSTLIPASSATTTKQISFLNSHSALSASAPCACSPNTILNWRRASTPIRPKKQWLSSQLWLPSTSTRSSNSCS